jgi:lycopene beta-cyclase
MRPADVTGPRSDTPPRYDYLLLGGGLQSGLIFMALHHFRPGATIALVERDEHLGGNHTWSFHAGDVPLAARRWFDPVVQWRWPGYEVRFPRYQRHIAQPYGAFSGVALETHLRALVTHKPGSAIFTSAEVTAVSESGAALSDGRTLAGRVVIDSRGPGQVPVSRHAGYQKFVGLELTLSRPHGLPIPILMDTLLPQTDGLRFMYVLPFSPYRVLVEDTYFSDAPQLDLELLDARIRSWVRARGWQIAGIERQEHGVLPMPYEAPEPRAGAIRFRGGYAGGWFNPATGYSLPLAVRFAEMIATHEIAELDEAQRLLLADRERQARFLLLLNRLLFSATPPAARRSVFERVYQLPPECLTRLYAMQLRRDDQLRILVSSPPEGVSLVKAARAVGHWALPQLVR